MAAKKKKKKSAGGAARNLMRDIKAEAAKESRKAKTQFQKGNKAAKGIERTPAPEAKQIQLLTRAMVTQIMSQYVGASMADLRKVTVSPTATMLERIVCRILLVSEGKADPYRLEFILNRTIGRVKEEIEIKPPNPYEGWTDEQLMAERERLASANLVTLRQTINASAPTKQTNETAHAQSESAATPAPDSGLPTPIGTEPTTV